MASEKVAIITAGGSGMGAAAAKKLASHGFHVAILSSSGKGEALAEELGGIGVTGSNQSTDDLQRLVKQAVDKWGRIDVLVNNAGVGRSGRIMDADDAFIDTIIDINLKGLLYMSREAIPHLLKTGGNIVNISSVSGTGGDSMLPVYNASKGAVTNLTRGLALQLGAKGVRVNAINPSITRSDMVEEITSNDMAMAAVLNRMALKRMGEPEDIAAATVFLASEDASFITGVNLPVDGGISASNGQPNMLG